MSRDYGAQFDFLETEPVGRALDCLGPRPTAGPFHYLINEQAKSLLALQELQHEVGALLEFRDLVIETFPSLRTKLAPQPPMAHHQRTAAPDWVPGVRVRRKLKNKSDAVPDSGFSTETSSKDTHSSSSTTAMAAVSNGQGEETDDELWSLLDLIHRKGTRLKEEVESLQDQLQPSNLQGEDVEEAIFRSSQDDVHEMRKERDELLSRVVDMEAEVVATRIHASNLQEEVERLVVAKKDLEERLNAILEERGEVNSRIRDLHSQFVGKSERTSFPGEGVKTCELDEVLGVEVPKVDAVDGDKFAAILAERNPTVLQRHLLSSTVRNEILTRRLEDVTKLEVDLVDRLGRAREENEELKFQLEDKSIELEGTRARMRMLEQLQKGPDVVPPTPTSTSTPTRGEILSSSMRNMSPIPMTSQTDQNISGAESGNDQKGGKRKPSKIPLKSYTAPKPPGRGKSSHSSAIITTPSRSRSGDSSLSRPHSAQSTRGGGGVDSLHGAPKSSSASSLSKSRNCSLVTSKDSLSSKLRGSDSLSRLSSVGGGSFGNRGAAAAALRKSSTPNVKWSSGGGVKEQATSTADKVRPKSTSFWNFFKLRDSNQS